MPWRLKRSDVVRLTDSKGQQMLRNAIVTFLLGNVLAGHAMAGGYPVLIEAVKDEDGSWEVVVHNKGPAPILIKVDLKDGVNVRSGAKATAGSKVLEPGAKETMIVAIPNDPAEAINFSWTSSWVFGRGTSKGEHDGLYRPPFPADLTFETLNSADGGHEGYHNMYAVDVMMPEGTPVIAARSGYVTDVKGEVGGDRVKEGGHPAYEDAEAQEKMGNYVRIWHDDGTFAEYLHLQDNSVRVTTGQRVEAGTNIGTSGKSGGAYTPHLHFAVMKPQAGFNRPYTMPMKIEMAGRGVIVAKAGESMGAAMSVSADASLVKNDPLVLAPVTRDSAKTSVGSSYERTIDKVKANRLEALLAIVVGLLGLTVGGLLWRFKKKYGRWPLGKAAQVEQPEGNGTENANANEDSEQKATKAWPVSTGSVGDQISTRPKRGYMFSAAEEGFHASLSLGLQMGYSVHAKVSLNRLMARPPVALDNPEVYAILRGESIDYAIVRNRDGKIVVAVEVTDDLHVLPAHQAARDMKAAMLTRVDIRTIKLPASAGPEQIRLALDGYVKQGGHHTEFGKAMARAG